jgi:hypothetical protein
MPFFAISRVLGLAISLKVLKINGEVMFRVSVRGLTLDEMQSPDEQKRCQEYDEAIKVKLDKGMQDREFKLDPDFTTHDCYEQERTCIRDA